MDFSSAPTWDAATGGRARLSLPPTSGRTLTVGAVLQAAVHAAAGVQLEVVLGGAVELAAPGRPAEVLVDAPTAARIPPQPCPGPRRGPARFQQAKQQKPDQAHPGIAPARGGGCASAGLTEGAALGAHARAPGCADCGWEGERGRGRPGRGGGQGREEKKEGGETRRDGEKGEMEKRTVERGKEGWREDAEKGRGRRREKTSNFHPGMGECSLAAHSSEERALGNKRRPWSPAGRGAQARRRLLTAPRPAPSGSLSSAARPAHPLPLLKGPRPAPRPIMPRKIIERGLKAAAPGPATPSRLTSILGAQWDRG